MVLAKPCYLEVKAYSLVRLVPATPTEKAVKKGIYENAPLLPRGPSNILAASSFYECLQEK